MKKVLKVIATTCIQLTKKQENSIVKTVEKKYPENVVRLKNIVDPNVIAGIKLTVGTQEIDATVYTKLAKLHTQLRRNI